MILARWALVVLGAVGLTAVFAAEPSRSIPKDTLPEKLALEEVPLGLERVRPMPKDNPLTEARAQLGRRLFFDPLLSADRTMACASCHDPAHGFASPDAPAIGVGGKRGTRKAPSLLNRAYGTSFFWDGRESTLEAQALRPIESPVEMATTVAEVVKRLKELPDYRRQFDAAFPEGVTADNLGRALASFERVLLAGNSRVDRFHAGDVAMLNERELHGLWLFESRGGCWRCHSGRNFSDEKFHNTGVGWGKGDLGRFDVTRQEADRGRFKTPTLRGVDNRPPFMHDGSLKTLEEVVEYYNRGGVKNPHIDADMAPLNLNKDEVLALVGFLKALSDSPAKK